MEISIFTIESTLNWVQAATHTHLKQILFPEVVFLDVFINIAELAGVVLGVEGNQPGLGRQASS